MTDEPKVEQIWRDPKTNRRLRVVGRMDSGTRTRVAVRNCETGRLSYLPLWRFEHWLVLEAPVSWKADPMTLHEIAEQLEAATGSAQYGDLHREAAASLRTLEAEKAQAEQERDDARLQLGMRDSTLAMTVARLGGIVEGNPTGRHNFLQRIDALRAAESNLASAQQQIAFWKTCSNCGQQMDAPGLCSVAKHEWQEGSEAMLEEAWNERDALKQQIADLTRWRPIETAPRDGTPILAIRRHGWSGGPAFDVAKWTDSATGQECAWTVVDEYTIKPTHWLPLPAAPATDAPR